MDQTHPYAGPESRLSDVPSVARPVPQSNPSQSALAKPAVASVVEPAGTEPGGFFGASLEPVLRRKCEGRLSPITWFRTDWQRGGAITGYATWTDDAGQEQPVVVKMPVPPGERRWLMRLQDADNVAPRLYAHGDALNGYDMVWVVMERLSEGPLGQAWGGTAFDLLVESIGRFYAATRNVPVNGEARRKDWKGILKHSRQQVRNGHLPEAQRWNNALKKAQKKLPDWLALRQAHPPRDWIHGDLHLGNAMTRVQPPGGPAILFDFAETRPGHWVQDAVYLEHLYWARRDRLEGRKLSSLIARERKRHGLSVEPDWPQLASTERALLAMSTPAALRADGDPRHVHAALEVLEREVA